MIKEAIKFIMGKAKESVIRLQIAENGIEYTNNDLKPILPPSWEKPAKLTFHTLTGLAEYIKCGGEMMEVVESDFAFARVKDFNQVYLSGQLNPENFNRRFDYAEAVLDINSFPFGTWIPLETFVISLQSQFEQTDAINEMLDYLGNLANEHVRENKDDGFSQTIQIRIGIQQKENLKIKNPLTLKPYRTFLEVDQPESKCILRLKEMEKELNCSLHIADGGMWKLEAINNISVWLEKEVGELVKILA